jgi:hypothetical protein
MNLDDFKEPWQHQQRELTEYADRAIKAIRTRMSMFDRSIFRRDLIESVAAICLFVYLGSVAFQISHGLARVGVVLQMLWCIEIVVVMNWARLTNRIVRPGISLQDYCTAELARVNRQIFLLRNVNWWYTGPCFLGGAIQLFGQTPEPRTFVLVLSTFVPIGWFVYRLNQRAVRRNLEPLRNELVSAMDVTGDESVVRSNGASSASTPKSTAWPWIRLVLEIAVCLAILITGANCFNQLGGVNVPKRSPFTDIRFEGENATVTYHDKTYQWLELDGIQLENIVLSSKRTYWWRWDTRICEDLIQVLKNMKHNPGDTVSLRLLDMETKQTVDVANAPMTFANHLAICAKRQPADASSDLAIDANLRGRLVGRYQLNRNFIFDVQDREGHLMVGVTNQSTHEVFPISATRWAYESVDATLEFHLPSDGPAEALTLHQNGLSQKAKRIE